MMQPTPSSSSYLPPAVMTIKAEDTEAYSQQAYPQQAYPQQAYPQQPWSLLPLPGPSVVPAAIQQANGAVPYFACIDGVQYYVMPPLPNEAALSAGDMSAYGPHSPGFSLPQTNPDSGLLPQTNPGSGLPQANPGSGRRQAKTTASRQTAMLDDAAERKRRLHRLEKNKECARVCRVKRKEHVNFLTGRLATLEAENKELSAKVQYMESLCSVYHRHSLGSAVPGGARHYQGGSNGLRQGL